MEPINKIAKTHSEALEIEKTFKTLGYNRVSFALCGAWRDRKTGKVHICDGRQKTLSMLNGEPSIAASGQFVTVKPVDNTSAYVVFGVCKQKKGGK